jgi:transposase
MRRSVISFVHVRRGSAAFANPASSCPASCSVTAQHYHRPAWTLLHRRWLASLKFDQAVHHIVLEDCIAAIEAATARRDRLEADIEAALPEWSLAPVVEALQALRGVGLVAAGRTDGGVRGHHPL